MSEKVLNVIGNDDDDEDDPEDIDYVPEKTCDTTGDDYDDDGDDVSDDDIEHTIRKDNRKRNKAELDTSISKKAKVLDENELKIKSDQLWSQFQKNVSSSCDSSAHEVSNTTTDTSDKYLKPASTSTSAAPVRTPIGKRGGVSAVLKTIGKKSQLTTLEKSKLDWNQFRKENEIESDLDAYKKSKNG